MNFLLKIISLASKVKVSRISFLFMTCLLLSFISNKTAAHSYRITPDTVTCYTNLDLKVFVTIDTTGMAYGGSIVLQLPPNWGRPQDSLYNLVSGAQNPVSVRCTTNNSVTFDIIPDDWTNPLHGIYTNEVHVCRFIVNSVVGLVNGDIVEIDFGNQFPGGNRNGGGYGFSPSRLAGLEHFYFQTRHDSLSSFSPVDSMSILQKSQNVYRLVALAKSNPDINTQIGRAHV